MDILPAPPPLCGHLMTFHNPPKVSTGFMNAPYTFGGIRISLFLCSSAFTFVSLRRHPPKLVLDEHLDQHISLAP